MKTLSNLERVLVYGGVCLLCFLAGYLSNGSASETDLLTKSESQDAEIMALRKTNQELSDRVSSLVFDISEIKRSYQQPERATQRVGGGKTQDSVQTAEVKKKPIQSDDHITAQKVDISEIGTTLVNDHGESSKYLDVAFKARLTNNNGGPIKVKVKFVLLSSEGFELDAESIYDPTFLTAGGSEIVTTTSMLTKSVYERIKSVEVRIRLD